MRVPNFSHTKCLSQHRRDMTMAVASRAFYKYYVLAVLTASFMCSEVGCFSETRTIY